MLPSPRKRPAARRYALMSVVAAVFAASACDPEPVEPDTGDAEDRIVYDNTHKTLATVPLLAYVAELFAADVSWKSLGPDIGARVAVGVTQARIDFVLGQFQCEREFESDNQTYLQGTFSNCTLTDFQLEGEFRADLTIETQPCPSRQGECSAAVVWSLAAPSFSIGKNQEQNVSRFDGPVILRDSIIDPDAPMTWETQTGFSLQAAGGEKFAARSTASWQVDPMTNCMDISVDARLELPEVESEEIEDIEIGEIVISATDVHYCTTHCPTEGRIEMAYGRGSILSWEYDGSDEVVVTGPGGREFSAGLECPPAP